MADPSVMTFHTAIHLTAEWQLQPVVFR